MGSSSLVSMTAVRDFINCFSKSPLGMVYLTLLCGGPKDLKDPLEIKSAQSFSDSLHGVTSSKM